MKKVRIIGVPEHFNLPWHLAISDGAFAQRGIALEWTDIPEGTGKMCQMLRDMETDLAIILTEGLVTSINQGNPARIVQEYIASPLLWGIHVAAKGPHLHMDDLEHSVAAISRLGSGSHLMAYVHAQQLGWDLKRLNFKVINNLEGAVDALTKGEADYFMWEHFTTKPLVDKNVFRRLGDCPTPWPCFVIAATAAFCTENQGLLEHILEVINLYTVEFKAIPSIDRTLANRYGQQLQDIREWLGKTQWSQSQISSETIEKVQDSLIDLKLIDKKMPYDSLVTRQ